MKMPTHQEIAAAHDAILRDGPLAESTLALAALSVIDPTLTEAIERLSRIAIAARELDVPQEKIAELAALIHGALVWGLDYGLRIGEARKSARRAARRAAA